MTSPLPAGECASLIVLTGSLGDVARGLPVASALKAARPRGRVSWVVERRWAPLVAFSAHVDRLVVFDRAAGLAGVARLLRDLRAERYDVAFDLQRLLKSGMIAWLSRAPRRIGFHPQDSKEGNHLFTTESVPALASPLSKVRHYLTFAEHVGVAVSEPPDFGLRADDVAAHLPARLRPRAYVAVVVGSSWPSKDWPARHWRRLCDLLVERTSLDVVLVGARGGHETEVGAAARALRLIDLRGRTSLEQVAAVLAGARLAVGPDTGPGHVAAALGTAYVGVFGPTDPARVAPWGCDGLAVRSPVRCDGCPKRRCRRGALGCMEAITAEQVWARVERTLTS